MRAELRAARAALVLLVLGLGAPRAAASREPAEVRDLADGLALALRHESAGLEAAQLLRQARRGGTPVAALCTRLARPELLPELLGILESGRIPPVAQGDAPQVLSAPQLELALSALARQPNASVRSALALRLPPAGAPLPPATALLELRVLSVIGGVQDLARIGKLAAACQRPFAEPVRCALREAWAAILRRHAEEFSRLSSRLCSLDPDTARELLFALGELGDARALPALDECARSVPALAQQSVLLLARLGPYADADRNRDLASWLAGELDPERSEWSRACLMALGVFDDGAAVPQLLDALESEAAGAREAALAALRRESGLDLGASAALWRAWFAGESEWMLRGRASAAAALRSRDPAQVVRALGQYAERRLARPELAEEVQPLLEHPLPAVRRAACETLARLRVPASLAALVECFGDRDPTVGEAAWRAASTISATALPREQGPALEALAARSR